MLMGLDLGPQFVISCISFVIPYMKQYGELSGEILKCPPEKEPRFLSDSGHLQISINMLDW